MSVARFCGLSVRPAGDQHKTFSGVTLNQFLGPQPGFPFWPSQHGQHSGVAAALQPSGDSFQVNPPIFAGPAFRSGLVKAFRPR